MLYVRNPSVAKRLFVLCNVILIATLYHRIEDAYQFALIAGGVVTFSFFLLRAIKQLVND